MLTSHLISSVLSKQTEKIYIAYSGGVDSHVLLHLVASSAELKLKVTAVYVHHGLQVQADFWAEHCQKIANTLAIDFICLNVNAQASQKQSPEEAARDARYQALKSILNKNDVLLLAQHREDQLETVLLQLFRGAGVQGLAGMPLSTDFGKGIMHRPFLDISKQSITDYANHYSLDWVEDLSNQCNDFDRNFLRNSILPKLKHRWPALDTTVARSARHCANTQQVINNLAIQLSKEIYDKTDHSLNISLLLKLPLYEQSLVIRLWFSKLGLKMPSEKTIRIILLEVIAAQPSAQPEFKSNGVVIKRYKNKLYYLKPKQTGCVTAQQTWPKELNSVVLADGQQLIRSESKTGISIQQWQDSIVTIKYRKGSEKIKLAGREGSHSLKKLYQEKSIPPWLRQNIPLIYLDEKLAAVADLWVSADFIDIDEQHCYQINLIDTEIN